MSGTVLSQKLLRRCYGTLWLRFAFPADAPDVKPAQAAAAAQPGAPAA